MFLSLLEKSLTEVDCGTKMGDIVGQIHASGIVHGDLTTSNFMIEGDKALVIDFGLGEFFTIRFTVEFHTQQNFGRIF